MDITYEIDDPFGGVPDGQRYDITDTDTDTRAWEALCADFTATMERMIGVGLDDYEVAPWHYETMSVFVYLYSRSFYYARFIHDVIEILSRHGQCFARFECFDGKTALGDVMIFPDGRVILSTSAVRTGLAESLGHPTMST